MSPIAPTDNIRAGWHMRTSAEHSSDMANSEIMEHGEVQERSYDNDDNEDPATQAASENLKHASISEKVTSADLETSAINEGESKTSEDTEKESARPITPEAAEPSDVQDEEMKERISSPKKKRGREQDDEARDPETAESIEAVGASPNGNGVNGGRTTRLAPEKKRHRDESVDTVTAAETGVDPKEPHVPGAAEVVKAATTIAEPPNPSSEISTGPVFGSGTSEKAQTSSTAFANSGFGSLAASSTSGFAALAASKPSVFGSGTAPQASGFGAFTGSTTVIPDTSKVTMGFGGPTESVGGLSGGGFGNATTTGFGALGGGFSAGFAGFTSGPGPKLSSFAASGTPEIAAAEKPTKAFGAPESDEEENSEEEDESKGGAASDEEDNASVDDKKKHRMTRVHINDGEEGEATLLQVRAKLFAFVKDSGWKERGAGNLRLNVPRIYVDYDENGTPIPGSFDPSTRDESDEEGIEPSPVSARLIMRQDNTHRVILNTVVLRGLVFEEKSSSSGAIQVLFTAFEDGNPVNVLLRMNEANAKMFTSEIRSVQQEL